MKSNKQALAYFSLVYLSPTWDVQCNTRSLNSQSYLRRADADVLLVFTFHLRNIKVTEQKTF